MTPRTKSRYTLSATSTRFLSLAIWLVQLGLTASAAVRNMIHFRGEDVRADAANIGIGVAFLVLSLLFAVLNAPRHPGRFLVRALGVTTICGVPSGFAYGQACGVSFAMFGFAVSSAMTAWDVSPRELVHWAGTQDHQVLPGA
ncbi:hypothetical protein MMC10_002542 [Thelotrema lepadinum]|nr:hypothetical protein [Thelotrema lepadinum]